MCRTPRLQESPGDDGLAPGGVRGVLFSGQDPLREDSRLARSGKAIGQAGWSMALGAGAVARAAGFAVTPAASRVHCCV